MILLFSLFSDRSSSDWREILIPGYVIFLLLIIRLKRVTDKFENQFIYLDNMYSFQLAFLIVHDHASKGPTYPVPEIKGY